MIKSILDSYTANVSSGIITLSSGKSSILVGTGSSVQLIRSSSLWLYWINASGSLRRAIVSEKPLALSSAETLAANVTSFFVRDITGLGVTFAYVVGTTLTLNVLGTIIQSDWPQERLPDFSFDLSLDLKTYVFLYMRPGSPTQAFVEYLTEGSTSTPKRNELKLLDFAFGVGIQI